MTSEPLTERTITFGPLMIAYDDRILTPRPWTEAQALWARDLLDGVPAGPVLELCSGAGHIGLLAVHETDRRLVCVDVDPIACAYAAHNAGAAGLADRVDVVNVSLEAFASDEVFALVVARRGCRAEW